ncbi:hypothetical protein [Burkholderia anthina]|uniref:hypothetical protein n=1 Tax=Burkholderia anthina TaxID=179879 RepID=UPI00384AF911
MHHHLVYRRWSPPQIAAGLREMHPDNPDLRVSHETICASFIGLSKSKHGNGPGTGKAISSKARSIVPARERWSNARRDSVVPCRMDGCTAEDALEGFTRQMKKLPAFLRES